MRAGIYIERGRRAAYLKALGGLEEGAERFLGHVHLAPVHELEQRSHVLRARPVEDDDQTGRRGRHPLEQLLEVLAACRQD